MPPKMVGNFWYEKQPPFDDFCKEIIEPGANEDFPNGAVGIRVDNGFWAVAALPYEYKDVPIEQIVTEYWPPHAADPGQSAP